VLWESYKHFQVTCLADPDLLEPYVSEVVLDASTAQANNLSGACELNLTGSLASNMPNTQIHLRYVDETGKQSDLKSITTDSFGEAEFEHSYALDLQTKTGGKIRIVGGSHAFTSNWADYQVDCGPADGLVSLLPPKASLEVETMQNTMHHGFICPVGLNIIAELNGRGTASGTFSIWADGVLKTEDSYDIEDGEELLRTTLHDLTWGTPGGIGGGFVGTGQAGQQVSSGQEPPEQSRLFQVKVFNAAGDQVDIVNKNLKFVCRRPATTGVADGAAGGFAPTPEVPAEAAVVTHAVRTETMHEGHACPAEVQVIGRVKTAGGPASGTAWLGTKDEIIAQQPYDLEEGESSLIATIHKISWGNVITLSGGIPRQSVAFNLFVTNSKDEQVDKKTLKIQFSCRKAPAVSQPTFGGGLAGQFDQPTHSQQAGGISNQQVVKPSASFSIQAPKGQISKGEIRLSGGQPSMKYNLNFFHKTDKGYRVVRLGLPKGMTGNNHTFKLSGMKDGDWRLRVCPANQGQQACKTSDFKVPKIKQPGGLTNN